MITFTNEKTEQGKIFIEIKAEDEIIKSKFETGNDQLDDYLEKINDQNENYFLLLTAHPIPAEHSKKIHEKGRKSKHLYFSEYAALLPKIKGESEKSLSIESLFTQFLIEKGYIMYQPDTDSQKDFLSFMALNFLEHQHGHGRVVSQRKISNGPIVFSKLVSNWQLISSRVNSLLARKGPPAIRYLPEQCTRNTFTDYEITDKKTYTGHRIAMRKARMQGRMWISAEVVIDDPMRLGWSVIYSIQNGTKGLNGVEAIMCKHIVSIRTHNSIHHEEIGEDMDFATYCQLTPDKVIEDLVKLIRKLEANSTEPLLI